MTDLKISTMTIVSKIGADINLRDMYDCLEPNGDLVCIEYANNPKKGDNKKKPKKIRKTTTPKKSFYNQATLHFTDKNKTNGKPVNMKIFNNGSCQMTGIPNMESATNIISKTKQLFLMAGLAKNIDIAHPINVCLINSGFSLGETVDRDHLFDILDNKYGFYVNYESDNYPGINLKYYWNDMTHDDADMCGRCSCESYCEGKGTGSGDGQCRRISIMIFQSGQVIITGCCTPEQIQFIHRYIINLCKINK